MEDDGKHLTQPKTTTHTDTISSTALAIDRPLPFLPYLVHTAVYHGEENGDDVYIRLSLLASSIPFPSSLPRVSSFILFFFLS